MSAPPVQRAQVEILGERYTIRGDADPGYMAEVGRLVDERMRDLASQAPGLPRARLAILAAINLADDLLQQRMEGGALEVDEEVAVRTRQLITLLDEGLIGDSLEYAAGPAG